MIMITKNSSSGISIFTILFLIFLVLKLTGKIDWSWWWVTSPMWIPTACILIFAVFCVLMAIIVKMITIFYYLLLKTLK